MLIKISVAYILGIWNSRSLMKSKWFDVNAKMEQEVRHNLSLSQLIIEIVKWVIRKSGTFYLHGSKIIAMLISIETCFYCSHLLKITFSSSHSLQLLPHLLHPMHSFVKDMSAGPVSSLTPAFSAERFSVRRSSLALPQNCSC